MGSELQRIQRRKKLLRKMRELAERAENVLIIHYSCESFYNREDGRNPRITSIAVRNLHSGQTDSFSIHQIAEIKKISINEIATHYDTLEYTMLCSFYEFVKKHSTSTWMHWNMRNINYGFAAIEHRYKVLSGTPEIITEDKKFDLSLALIILYGINYIEKPRLEKIKNKNNITDLDFLTGQEEAKAFEDRQFVKMHQSTLRKVAILSGIFERTIDGTLKTNSSWCEQRGYTLKAIAEFLREHWLASLVCSVTGIISFVYKLLSWFGIL